jgi:hypothetical protein
MVAYALEPVPNSDDYFIDVYDPNRPFTDAETTTPFQPTAHMAVEQASRIRITAPGAWSFTMKGGQAVGGDLFSLQVYPASLIADGVTFPVTPTGVLTVDFGAAASAAPATPTWIKTPLTARSQDDRPLQVAQAAAAAFTQAGFGKHASPAGAEHAEVFWQAGAWLRDPLSAALLFTV